MTTGSRLLQNCGRDISPVGKDSDQEGILSAADREVPQLFRIGLSLIDRRTRCVKSPAGEQRLRLKELELVVHLYGHVALTFSRQQLLQLVWNCQPGLMTRTVDQTVATLRKKIEPDPERPRFLQTVHGIGYRLVL